ncbi:hypothetical protein [Luteibacter sp. 621]|uniref:hypothetical protein n=1 Tax=Luteibacter sp. 621 TaxID=3373916 RepID=UPI003D1B4221
MKKWTACTFALVAALALGACSKSNDQAANAPASAAAKKGTVPRPAATADENTWGLYLADQGKVHADDIGMRPYIYVIPAGEGSMAEDRRKNETDSIVHGAGSILIPGALLILGGPDATVTNAFIESLGKEVKPDTLKGVTVLIVGDGAQKDAQAKMLAATGARVRVAAM